MKPRYRAWIKEEKCFADYVETIRYYAKEIDLCWGGICESDCFNFEYVIFTQSTRFTDDIGEEIFEGDVIIEGVEFGSDCSALVSKNKDGTGTITLIFDGKII